MTVGALDNLQPMVCPLLLVNPVQRVFDILVSGFMLGFSIFVSIEEKKLWNILVGMSTSLNIYVSACLNSTAFRLKGIFFVGQIQYKSCSNP